MPEMYPPPGGGVSAAELQRRRGGLQRGRTRHPLGGAIRRTLQRVIDLPDPELCLDCPSAGGTRIRVNLGVHPHEAEVAADPAVGA